MSDFAYLKTLNKGQYEAATTIHGPVRILAGAGSGKTHTLISRVAYMVDSGIPPEQILLLTFTNNAAKNMVKRAAALSNPACAKITACTYHSFCAKLSKVTQSTPPDRLDQTGGECVGNGYRIRKVSFFF